MGTPSERTVSGARIAKVVRSLRRERAWTQAELARKLGLSQSRLSEIEGGEGSFTAEQFLQILKLFNVTTNRFTGGEYDRDAQLQNALARLGAYHLQEQSDAVPAADLDDVSDVVRETLLGGEPRLLTALAPVLVSNIDRIRLGKIYLDLGKVGLDRRLGWVCDNTLASLGMTLHGAAPRVWSQRAQRASVLLSFFVDAALAAEGTKGKHLVADALDPGIRSKKTLDHVRAASSNLSRKWDIVSSLSVEDFADALRAARVAHP